MKTKNEEAAQVERFKKAARELGANEDEAAFDEALRRVARQKLKAEPKRPPKDESK